MKLSQNYELMSCDFCINDKSVSIEYIFNKHYRTFDAYLDFVSVTFVAITKC